jgi:hypothetical protein
MAVCWSGPFRRDLEACVCMCRVTCDLVAARYSHYNSRTCVGVSDDGNNWKVTIMRQLLHAQQAGLWLWKEWECWACGVYLVASVRLFTSVPPHDVCCEI